MTSKSRPLYDAVLQTILGAFRERYPNAETNVSNFMSDYERAMQSAAREAFDGCEITGCYFHFSQVLKYLYFFLR